MMKTFSFADREAVLNLLTAAGLPTADLPAELAHFALLRENGTPVACGGLEVYGTAALLRSVAVTPALKGNGLGGEMVRQLRAIAAAAGVQTLYLLTTDAADFFRQHGFAEISRELVPSEILHTQQFASICPSSATAMRGDVLLSSTTL